MDLQVEFGLRLLAALAAGAVIGLERTYHGRPAGFRTLALVSLGAALLMAYATLQIRLAPAGASVGDALAGPQRVVQGVMTGIGFLGAGVIFKDGMSVHGLTTAATVWATAALGLILGAGLWWPGTLTIAAILFTISVLRWAEDRMPHEHLIEHVLKFEPKNAPEPEAVRALLAEHGFRSLYLAQGLNDVTGLVEYRGVASTFKAAAADGLGRSLRTHSALKGFELAPADE